MDLVKYYSNILNILKDNPFTYEKEKYIVFSSRNIQNKEEMCVLELKCLNVKFIEQIEDDDILSYAFSDLFTEKIKSFNLTINNKTNEVFLNKKNISKKIIKKLRKIKLKSL